MVRFFVSIFFIAQSFFIAQDAGASDSKPTSSEIVSIGSYGNGCILNSGQALEDGIGYRVVRKRRMRFYGHPEAIRFVKRVGKAIHSKKIGNLLVGDISQKGGGLMPWGHRSHQNGLDVDILFRFEKISTPLSAEELNTIQPISMLTKEHDKVSSENFNGDHIEVLKLIANDNAVDRIFVHPHIKKKLCRDLPKTKWLRKIRPWYGHHNHFHVRIKCPDNSPTCKPTVAIPQGLGCRNLDFAYWFSEKANLEKISRAEPSPDHKKPPVPEHKKHPGCRAKAKN